MRLSLYGFYQYDSTLFDGIVLPTPYDRDILINEIIKKSGDLYPYHQVPDMLKNNITLWFTRKSYDFSQMYDAIRGKYNPLENYDRYEEISRKSTNSGSDSNTNTTSSTSGNNATINTTSSNTDEKGVSAYNETTYTNREKDTQTGTNGTTNVSTTTDSGTDNSTTNYGLVNDNVENNHLHGNIGVTTAQQLITGELELRKKYDLYEIIAAMFEKEFIIQIY